LSDEEKATVQATKKKKPRKHLAFRAIERRDRDFNL
tara:strand:- start:5841 stop:5948 length:108 start_codon:yes stop_codon:yes gene_type:complete